MRVFTPDNIQEIPYSKAILKKLNGVEMVVIDDRYFFPYSKWEHQRYCKTTEYHTVIDMLPDYMDVKPILNDESLLSYAWWNKERWSDVHLLIEDTKLRVTELEEFIK